MEKLTLLQKLKLLTLNYILREPAFLKGIDNKKDKSDYIPAFFLQQNTFREYAFKDAEFIFCDLVDKCLDCNFYNTLTWASELRLKYNLTATANAILVRSSFSRTRKDLTKNYKGLLNYFNEYIIVTPRDLIDQVEYFLYINNGKNCLPSILKRSWAKRLQTFSLKELYTAKKYRCGIASIIKLTHAKSQSITDFLNGKKPPKVLSMGDTNGAEGFVTVFYNGQYTHKELLDNLVRFFTSYKDEQFCLDYMQKIYNTADFSNFSPIDYIKYIDKVDETENINHKKLILKWLNNCFYRCMSNQPKSNEKTLVLLDGSFGARYTDVFKLGEVKGSFGKYNTFYINALYSLLLAKRYEDADICTFSDSYKIENPTDDLIVDPIPYAEYKLDNEKFEGTCCYGIYSFLVEILLNRVVYDNIYIFSNNQAMLGTLSAPSYKTEFKESPMAIKKTIAGHNYYSIDVARIISNYRFAVNNKVNVVSVKTNSKKSYSFVDFGYRTAIVNGFTGKEAEFIFAINEFWDSVEKGE